MRTPGRFPAVVLLPLMTLLEVSACAGQSSREPESTPSSFAVYALSIGKGVPEEASKALEAAREILEEDRRRGVGLKIFQTIIGLEGERRLCVVYDDAEAAESSFRKITELSEGVELINILREACEPSSTQSNPQEMED